MAGATLSMTSILCLLLPSFGLFFLFQTQQSTMFNWLFIYVFPFKRSEQNSVKNLVTQLQIHFMSPALLIICCSSNYFLKR